MSFINWGSESPEQLKLRKRFEEEQAIFEQRAAAVSAAAAAAAGSGGSKKEKFVLVMDSGFAFYRFNLITGETFPLTEDNNSIRPIGITGIQDMVTDPVSGDVWLRVDYNPCFPSRCPGSGLVRLSIDGDSITWHEIVDTQLSRSGLAWLRVDSSIISTEDRLALPNDVNGFDLLTVDRASGESTVINGITYSNEMALITVVSSETRNLVRLLFRYPSESERVDSLRYSLIEIDPYSRYMEPLLPEDGLVFNSRQVNSATLDLVSGDLLCLCRVLREFRISSINVDGETVSEIGVGLDARLITGLK